jgi:hypothetical protein
MQAGQAITPGGGGGGGSPGNLFSWNFTDTVHPWGPDPVGGFTLDNGGGGSPDYTIDTTDGFNGSTRCALGDYPNPPGPGDGGGVMYLNLGSSHTHVWIVGALKWVTVPQSGAIQTKKMVIFRQSGFNTQYGEMNCVFDDMEWIWLQDAGATLHTLGIANPTTTIGSFKTFKMHYDQSTNKPQMTIGYDGVDSIFQLRATDVTAQDMQIIDFGGPLNATSGACKYKWAYLQVGTVDPGWP